MRGPGSPLRLLQHPGIWEPAAGPKRKLHVAIGCRMSSTVRASPAWGCSSCCRLHPAHRSVEAGFVPKRPSRHLRHQPTEQLPPASVSPTHSPRGLQRSGVSQTGGHRMEQAKPRLWEERWDVGGSSRSCCAPTAPSGLDAAPALPSAGLRRPLAVLPVAVHLHPPKPSRKEVVVCLKTPPLPSPPKASTEPLWVQFKISRRKSVPKKKNNWRKSQRCFFPLCPTPGEGVVGSICIFPAPVPPGWSPRSPPTWGTHLQHRFSTVVDGEDVRHPVLQQIFSVLRVWKQERHISHLPSWEIRWTKHSPATCIHSPFPPPPPSPLTPTPASSRCLPPSTMQERRQGIAMHLFQSKILLGCTGYSAGS